MYISWLKTSIVSKLIAQRLCNNNSVLCCRANDQNALEVDFAALDYSMPRLTLSSSIGNGATLVSKFITSTLSQKLENSQPLVDYLLSLNHLGDVWERQHSII